MSLTPLYLCVDCGGTKTSAVICNTAAQVVGRASGGPSNFSYLGPVPFVTVLKTTVEQALSTSAALSSIGVDSSLVDKFASVWIGVSGVDSPNDIRTLTATLSPVFGIPPGNRLQVTNDANLLASPLRVHTELENAVTVIAGTGSVVISFARGDNQSSQASGPTPFKEVARIGGWGWILGDIGSGFEVGREALREILIRADRLTVCGMPATIAQSDPKSLQSRVLEHFGITAVPDLFGVVYSPDPLPAPVQSLLSNTTSDPSHAFSGGNVGPLPVISLLPRERRLSQLTPLVFKAAFQDGDELALTVVKRCAGSLAHHIASVLVPPTETSCVLRNAVDAASSVLCLGGSLVGIAAYREIVLEELARLGHVFPIVEFVGGGDVAAAGAKGLAAAGKS